MGAGGSVPDGRLEAISADVAGLKLGQTRLATRVDAIQATQAEHTRTLLELAAKQAAESAREAVLAKASIQAINRLAELTMKPHRERGRTGARPTDRPRQADSAEMEIEGVPIVSGSRRSRSPARSGSVSRHRLADGTGAGVKRVDGESDHSYESV